MIRLILMTTAALALTACASFDAAHIAGQNADAQKYRDYSDVEMEKQRAVTACFTSAGTASATASDLRIAMCALYGQGVGMASTFGGRPTNTAIAPTTMQAVGGVVQAVAPYAAAAAIAKSVSQVQAKDPITVTQPEPVIVRPEVVQVPATAP